MGRRGRAFCEARDWLYGMLASPPTPSVIFQPHQRAKHRDEQRIYGDHQFRRRHEVSMEQFRSAGKPTLVSRPKGTSLATDSRPVIATSSELTCAVAGVRLYRSSSGGACQCVTTGPDAGLGAVAPAGSKAAGAVRQEAPAPQATFQVPFSDYKNILLTWLTVTAGSSKNSSSSLQ